MQGLPINNLLKSSQSGKSISSHNENLLEVLGENVVNESGKSKEQSADFLSILESVDGKKVSEDKVVALSQNNQIESGPFLKMPNEKNAEVLNTKISKTNTNLENLLNNLKRTNIDNSSEVNSTEENGESKLPFEQAPKLKSQQDTESPLDFLVKNAKTTSTKGELNSVEGSEKILEKATKNNFFPNSKVAGSEKNISKDLNTKLVSSEDFLNNRETVKTDPSSLKNLKLQDISRRDDNIIDLKEFAQMKNQEQFKGYQNGQNILNDNVIRTTKDMAFKDSKKTKIDSIDELKNSELKTTNQLNMIKEPLIPVVMMENGKKEIIDSGKEGVKILDLSNTKIENTNQLIQKISDYVMQSTVGNKDQIDLVVKHDSLGEFQIQVNKAPNQKQVDMQIVTSSPEGHKFFVEHETALVKSLQGSGIQLSDFRVVSSMTEITANSIFDSKQSSSFSHGQNSNSSNQEQSSFQSFSSGDFRQGKERRNELWNEYRERYGA